MVGEHPTQTTLPGDDLKPAWRAACIAYREVAALDSSISQLGLQRVLPFSAHAPILTSAQQAAKPRQLFITSRCFTRSGSGTASAILDGGSASPRTVAEA
jgi:hypothetical protein